MIAKARELVNPLKEKWALTLREAGGKIAANGGLDSGATTKDLGSAKFESSLEDFYAICDQIELNLKSAIDCINQTDSSNNYMKIAPMPNRLDNGEQQTEFLSYPAYIATSKQQIAFARDVRNLLNQAASDVVNQRYN